MGSVFGKPIIKDVEIPEINEVPRIISYPEDK